MSQPIDDHQDHDPFGWGRRTIRQRDLADLMGSPDEPPSDADASERPATDSDGSGTEPSSDLADLMEPGQPFRDEEDAEVRPAQASPEPPSAPEPSSVAPDPDLAVEEELWEAIHRPLTPAPRRAESAETATAGPEPGADAPTRTATGSTAARSAIDTRKLQMLRLLLMANVVMIAVMLALPHPLETRPEYGDESRALEPVTPLPGPQPVVAAPESGASTTDSAAPRRPQLGLPDDARYEQALLFAMEGRFDEASGALRTFLKEHPDLNPAVERLVHAHLAYYLRKSGRVSEAIEHENRMRELAGTASLPEELLEAARAAERSGDGVAMRRAYAQFLLQREQLSPSMQALIEEAWLGFGDSYRVEADASEERSR